MTTSIIIYRNPLEEAFYENGGPLILMAVCAIALVWILVYVTTDKVVHRFWPRATRLGQWKHTWIVATTLTIAATQVVVFAHRW